MAIKTLFIRKDKKKYYVDVYEDGYKIYQIEVDKINIELEG